MPAWLLAALLAAPAETAPPAAPPPATLIVVAPAKWRFVDPADHEDGYLFYHDKWMEARLPVVRRLAGPPLPARRLVIRFRTVWPPRRKPPMLMLVRPDSEGRFTALWWRPLYEGRGCFPAELAREHRLAFRHAPRRGGEEKELLCWVV
jgi:hypothetical protein